MISALFAGSIICISINVQSPTSRKEFGIPGQTVSLQLQLTDIEVTSLQM